MTRAAELSLGNLQSQHNQSASPYVPSAWLHSPGQFPPGESLINVSLCSDFLSWQNTMGVLATGISSAYRVLKPLWCWSYQWGPVQRALKGCCRLLPTSGIPVAQSRQWDSPETHSGSAFSPASNVYCWVDFVLFCINRIRGFFSLFLWCTNIWDVIPELKFRENMNSGSMVLGVSFLV